jgi:hypothetical protein
VRGDWFQLTACKKDPFVARAQLSPVVNPNGLGRRGNRSCGVHACLAIIVLPNDGEQEGTSMRRLVLTTVTAIGIGLLGLSGASAVPANGIAVSQATAADQLVQPARWWRRHYRWHRWHRWRRW